MVLGSVTEVWMWSRVGGESNGVWMGWRRVGRGSQWGVDEDKVGMVDGVSLIECSV